MWKITLCIVLGALIGAVILYFWARSGGDTMAYYPVYVQGPDYPPASIAVNCQQVVEKAGLILGACSGAIAGAIVGLASRK